MAKINYEAKLIRVFEEKDSSARIHYGYIAEVQIRSPEPNAQGTIYTYTLRLPISAKQFGDLEKKLQESKAPIPFDLGIDF